MKTKDKVEIKEENGRFWWRSEAKPTCQRAQPMPGDPCSHCHEGTLVFNGLLILLCDKCQEVADYGGFT